MEYENEYEKEYEVRYADVKYYEDLETTPFEFREFDTAAEANHYIEDLVKSKGHGLVQLRWKSDGMTEDFFIEWEKPYVFLDRDCGRCYNL